MTAILAFLAALGGIAGWWLSHQRLTAKPWLEEGVIGPPGSAAARLPAAKIGLGFFLAVVGSLFALLLSAYSMRMRGADWASLPDMRLLWFNTGVLVVGSVALQAATIFARRGEREELGVALLAGSVATLVFLAGQLLVWQELTAAGFVAANNPASAFFYLLTALHGLHLLGGMLALGRVTVRTWRLGGDASRERAAGLQLAGVRLGAELCAWYWHFLLAVWIVLFATLSLGAWWDRLYAICFGA